VCDILLQVLKKEFPKGIDIIYESVGGDMLKLCLDALAVHGRLIVIGMISQVFTYFSSHATIVYTSTLVKISPHLYKTTKY
jgi:NADPH-dependent curcumin reductase CurA